MLSPVIRPLRIALLAAGLAGAGFAHADVIGLRVDPGTWEVRHDDGKAGLTLAFSDDDLTIGPGTLTRSPQGLQSFGWHAAPKSSSAWADWRPFNNGWRTTVGLVWQQNVVTDRFSADGENEGTTAIPFLGFGWSGDASPKSGWRLSAEVGAYMANSQACLGQAGTCRGTTAPGLRIGTPGDGMHVTPYLSFGASFLY